MIQFIAMSGIGRVVARRSINFATMSRAYSTNLGDLGSGAGKGGGGGGSVREAGGSLGQREAALEGEYFYKKQQEQLRKLKHDLTDEISFHEEQIKRHQEAIQRQKDRVADLEKERVK